jgi:hypothetical protein
MGGITQITSQTHCEETSVVFSDTAFHASLVNGGLRKCVNIASELPPIPLV